MRKAGEGLFDLSWSEGDEEMLGSNCSCGQAGDTGRREMLAE